ETDVFLRDLSAGTTRLVSVNAAGTGSGDGASDHPLLSRNGKLVAFVSFASDLVANDANGAFDAFVRDVVAGTTTLVSVNQAGTGSGNSYSIPTGFSTNGRFVVFPSAASDLVPNDTNGVTDVFARDLK